VKLVSRGVEKATKMSLDGVLSGQWTVCMLYQCCYCELINTSHDLCL